MSPWHSACIGPPVLLEPEFRPRTEAWTDPWSNRPDAVTTWTQLRYSLHSLRLSIRAAAQHIVLILQNTLAPVRVTIWIQVKMCRCVRRCDAYVQEVKLCVPKLDDIAKASTVWSFRSISLSTQLSWNLLFIVGISKTGVMDKLPTS